MYYLTYICRYIYIFIALIECVLIKECIIKEAGIIFDTKKKPKTMRYFQGSYFNEEHSNEDKKENNLLTKTAAWY